MFSRVFKIIEFFWGHPGVRYYGGNLIWLLVEKVFRILAGFSVGIYVARRLGPSEYGALNYAVTFVLMFSILSGTWMDSVAVRELVKAKGEMARGVVLGTLAGLKAAGFLVMAGVIVSVLFLSGADGGTKVLVLLITGGYLFQFLQVTDLYFQAEVKSKFVAMAQMGALLIISILRGYFAYRGAALEVFALLEGVVLILTMVFCGVAYRWSGESFRSWRFSLDEAKYLLKVTWPLFWVALLAMAAMRMDVLILKHLTNDEVLGNYSVAMRLAELFFFISIACGSTFFPAIVRSKEVSPTHYRNRVEYFLALLFFLNLVITLAMLVVGPVVIWFYGAAYRPAVPIFWIYVWRLPFCGVFTGVNYYLTAENRMKDMKLLYWFYTIMTVALDWILTIYWGAYGAAAGLTIATIATVYVFPLFFRRFAEMNEMLRHSLNPLGLLRKKM